MKRMIIGIPISISNQSGKITYKIYARYEEYLHHFDISTILLTPLNSSYLMSKINGVLLAGGDDVNPNLYEKETKSLVDDYQDNFEISIIKKALLLKKPILGICRGIQIINVYFKGSLKNVVNHNDTNHLVYNKNKSKKIKSVNSYHNQAIDVLAEGLTPLEISEDNIIEAIIDKKRMIFAVQYHPELTYDSDFIEVMKSLLTHTIKL